MHPTRYVTAGLLIFCALNSGTADALTVREFGEICRQAGRPCAEVPVLRAYVGGALDLVATLDERTR